MHSFDLSAPKMRDGFEDYLDIVMALCESAGAKSGTAHMTVDEKVVVAGRSQTRIGSDSADPRKSVKLSAETEVWS